MNSFVDRREAGRMLAARLGDYANRSDVTVLAVPRGGVPVAYELARALAAPLDVFLVHKVYKPGRDDVHVGTITSGGFELLETATIDAREVDQRVVTREMARAREDLSWQELSYRGNRPLPDVRGRTIILVYDGIVTGSSMAAAVGALRARGAARVVVATPVAPPNAVAALSRIADACVCVMTVEPFYRIGIWYDDFAPVTDASVVMLLDCAARTLGAAAA
jgi:putative phosphoribosyl transferase